MAGKSLEISPVRHRFLSEQGPLRFGLTGGLLVFAAVSGLAIWLSPFGTFAQVSVILHTAIGLVAVAAFAIWQLSHWLGARRAPRTLRKISAYVGFWLFAASCVAGLVVTWQALFGLYMNHLWSRIHLWTGVLALPFLAYHLMPAGERLEPDHGPERRRIWKTAVAVAVALLAVSGIVTVLDGGPAVTESRAYDPKVFALSNAAVEGGHPLSVSMLANSDSCGVSGCHRAIYEEWRASAHRWSAEDQFFQTVRSAVTELHGHSVTEKCSVCHDPVSLLSGNKDPTLGAHAPGHKEGDSCVVCHAVRKVDERGIGSYVLRVPQPYLYQTSSSPLARKLNHFLIRAYPGQHSRDYSLAPVRRPESCAPCHKEYDVIVEQQGPVQVETQYDDWKQGKWNTDRYPAQRLYCQQCHMYYLEPADENLTDPYDLKAGLGRKHRNHFFAAGNQFMPAALDSPDAAGQIRRVTEWLRGERVVPEIKNVWAHGPVIALKIEAPLSAQAGANLRLQVVLSNNKAGHGFPTGPLNIVRVWLELTVDDGAGREIFHSGRLDSENHIEPGSYVLKPLAIDLHGRMIMEPDLWHPEGPQYRPAILAGQSAAYAYEFRAPRGVPGPLVVRARLRYRKANQFFMDSVYPGAQRTAPVTDLSSGRVDIALAGAAGRGGL